MINEKTPLKVGVVSFKDGYIKRNPYICIMKIIILLICTTLGLYSCVNNRTYYDTDQSKFVVKEVLERKGMSKMTTYRVLMLDASGIGEKEFWIVDSIGKYNVGDRLWLQPCQ